VLLALAVGLIMRGEPQPSSRPSGTSVGVSGSATAPATVPSLLVIRAGVVESRQPHSVRRVPLPRAARPLSIVTGRGLSVVLAAVNGHQRAYAVRHNLTVRDLGLADAVIPAALSPAAVLIETGLTEPGLLTRSTAASPTASAISTVSGTASGTASASPSPTGPPELRDFEVRRFDANGQPIGTGHLLPVGSRLATDTPVGLVVWQPANRVFDNGVALEPLSAAATLIRPDGSFRKLGPFHPLAADATDLLVWDVALRRFGLMPLRWATSTLTSTVSPSPSRSSAESNPTRSGPTESSGTEFSKAESSKAESSAESGPTVSPSASPSVSPSTVAGVRWFQPTRGITVVTGPASFNADGSAFAVYAQVGSRRRLVVAELQNLGTDKVEVLALVQPPVPSSQSSRSAVSGPVMTVSGSGVAPSGPQSASKTASASGSLVAIQPDGFPIQAPLTPVWWKNQVLAVGTDATVVGYRPGSQQAALLDLGPKDLQAIAELP
jgi:hypothetical protein